MPDPISRAEMIALRSHLEWLDGETKEGVDWSDVSEPLRRCLAHLERTQPTDTQADLTRARDLAGKLWWMAQLPWDKAEPNMTAALQSEREATAAEAVARNDEVWKLHNGLTGKFDQSAEERTEWIMQQSLDGLMIGPTNRGTVKKILISHFRYAAAEARRAALLEAEIACGPETWAGFRIRALVSQEADNG